MIALTLTYSDESGPDMEVEAWLDEIALKARARNCTCTIEAQWGERRWRHDNGHAVERIARSRLLLKVYALTERRAGRVRGELER